MNSRNALSIVSLVLVWSATAFAQDPVKTEPTHYKVVFENDAVRVLEYNDQPGQRTSPHEHPNSVMYTLSTFRRRLINEAGQSVEVELSQGETRWLDGQVHSGENIGDTATHVLFVELKSAGHSAPTGSLGPSTP